MGTFRNSRFGQSLEKGLLNLPPPERLPSATIAPHVFVGDEAFPLRPDFLRPYTGNKIEDDKRIFNYRLSRARRCVENAFGIMASRFRIFRRTTNLLPENVDCIVMASYVFYIPPNYADRDDEYGNITDGQWRSTVEAEGSAMFESQPPVGHNYSSGTAHHVTRASWKLAALASSGLLRSRHGWKCVAAISIRPFDGRLLSIKRIQRQICQHWSGWRD
ncbi:hypothetical protein HPB50_017016 [Hyalomma asiaticum]|uniref:Uncharacterized protein n=1 Tax=Hyalomma asiaticum TaxID=266040 RepID=A0ACB7RJQ8_HYAAI|nr:hypothetical protein HPB50_017016 [Hyalomma asiaticum]